MLNKSSIIKKSFLSLSIILLYGCDKASIDKLVGVSTKIISAIDENTKNIDKNEVKIKKTTIKSILIQPSQVILQKNEEKLLTAFVYTDDGQIDSTNKNIIWESEDRGIADIDEKGKIKAIRAGETGILAKEKTTGIANRIIIKILQTNLVNKIEISPGNLNLKPGDSKDLIATVILSDNTKNGNVEWYSSDNTIATVDEFGKVSAKRLGTVSIVATYKLDNSYKNSVDINVNNLSTNIPNVPIQTANGTPSSNSNNTNISQPQSSAPIPVISTPVQSSPLSSPVYIPANLSLSEIEITESIGNGDNIPNKGETFILKPVFSNIGGAPTNKLTVKLSSNTSGALSGDGSIILNPIKAGLTSSVYDTNYSSNIRVSGLGLQIDDNFSPGTSTSITFSINDDFGNTWSINGSVEIKNISNTIELSKIDIVETIGNGPNNGETIIVKPIFKNTGSSTTNKLTVKLSSGNSLATSGHGSIILNPIKAGLTSSVYDTSYSSNIRVSGLGLSLSKETQSGSNMPLTFNISDDFGNSWIVNGNIEIK